MLWEDVVYRVTPKNMRFLGSPFRCRWKIEDTDAPRPEKEVDQVIHDVQGSLKSRFDCSNGKVSLGLLMTYPKVAGQFMRPAIFKSQARRGDWF